MREAFVYSGECGWERICEITQRLFDERCAHWCGDAVDFSGGNGTPNLQREWDEGAIFDGTKELRWCRKDDDGFMVQIISDEDIANTGLERIDGTLFADFNGIQRHDFVGAAHLRVAGDVAERLNRLSIEARRVVKNGKIIAVSLRLEKTDGA
ncbi:MAG: hypothetical protein DRP82_00315 [Planctomycetota bacterium]|nr:MAG: hypothetical protein DRP82_00315 [Planctomycetota bacterium]